MLQSRLEYLYFGGRKAEGSYATMLKDFFQLKLNSIHAPMLPDMISRALMAVTILDIQAQSIVETSRDGRVFKPI
ncbi:hypothetical protein [Okeania sp. SIO1H2]|uniref:Uncharacterized protein n=2 Tax=Okeania TaxID=1458928 RepID=A0A3N6RPQ5_9CYAN|nr:hypothetical protein [Okeania sp. SIO1H2]NEQ95049.1 hypothetical protein [Okeania sp. SIO2G4]NET97563.1 hypothetical protein [Okeania sp. SIO1H2]RQH53462.1 hypothetical protein D5R40_04150 [Okeania hirsuta]